MSRGENTIVLTQDRAQLLLCVSDDGKGFPVQLLYGSKALGLLELRERTAALQGDLEIRSAPGKGTTITIRVTITSPLDPAKDVAGGAKGAA